MDKEQERRGIRFARYADDAIFVMKRLCDAQMVLQEITVFLNKKLKLVVNKEKSKVGKMLVAARLRHISGSTWSERKYLNMDLLIGYNMEENVS